MAKRTRKPPIRPELRREWFRRHEDTGESPQQIAAKDRYDVRTVRKQIELAKQEREVREARTLVMRSALERHYDDLRDFAERLNSRVLGLANIRALPDDDLKEIALRQHMPRSPIWSYMAKLEGLHQRSEEEPKQVRAMLERNIGAESRIIPLVNAGAKSVIPAIVNALTAQAKQWAYGGVALNTKDNLIMEPVAEGLVNPSYGAFHMGPIPAKLAGKHRETLKQVIDDLELKLKESDEYRALDKTVEETERVQKKLREELAIIRLRRIVPGHCKFCPL